MNHPHHDLPILGGIAGFLHWLESLAVIASGPLLTLGLGVALVDLLTDGKLLATTPWLLMAWAISQAVGIDAQLVGSSFQLAHSLRSRRFLAAAGYGMLVIALGYVGFIAAQIFSVQQADGVTTAQALGALGLDSTSWIVQRSGLSVVLVVLSGLLRYVQPAKVASSLEDERAKLERELELEPLRQRLRGQKAAGAAGLARQAIAAARGKPVDDQPPTGPGTPVQATPAVAGDAADAPEPRQLRAVSQPREMAATNARSNGRKRRRVRTRSTRTVSAEAKVREVWQPGMSVGELQAAAGIGRSTASKWSKIMATEAAQQVAQ
jgi:hypothetical protein